MVKQFLVVLMNTSGIKNFLVNCNDIISAGNIAKAIHPSYRIIEIKENR